MRRGDPYYDSGRFSRSTMHVPGWQSHYAGHGLYTSNSTYSLRRPIEPGDKVGSLANINHFHVPAWRRPSATSHYMIPSSASMAAGAPTPSTENVHSSMGLGLMGMSTHRPISAPPKPGYTQTAGGRASTPGGGYGSAISPGPGMHFNDFSSGVGGRHDDAMSQQSFR